MKRYAVINLNALGAILGYVTAGTYGAACRKAAAMWPDHSAAALESEE